MEGEEALLDEEDNKKFRVCEICTIDELEPCMILNSKWEVHCQGRVHRNRLRIRSGGKRVAMTGPEVEAKRKERQLRREGNNSP